MTIFYNLLQFVCIILPESPVMNWVGLNFSLGMYAIESNKYLLWKYISILNNYILLQLLIWIVSSETWKTILITVPIFKFISLCGALVIIVN